MDKNQQDLAWNCLPREFRKEVKRMWSVEGDCAIKYKSELHKHRTGLMYELFGDNLTSDAEGEEMLSVSRKRVQELYKCYCTERDKEEPGSNRSSYGGRIAILQELFGSVCLPNNVDSVEHLKLKANSDFTPIPEKTVVSEWDKSEPSPKSVSEISEEIADIVAEKIKAEFAKIEPKTAEPKFKVGDIVCFKYCCTPHRIDGFKTLDGVMLYQVGEVWAEESDLEPYTEPKEEASPNVNHSDLNIDELVAKGYVPDPAKQFDTIIKDGFAKERRLNIAAMAMQGILTRVDDTPQVIAEVAFRYADALISECEKGGTE